MVLTKKIARLIGEVVCLSLLNSCLSAQLLMQSMLPMTCRQRYNWSVKDKDSQKL